jgi:hypothetical protein
MSPVSSCFQATVRSLGDTYGLASLSRFLEIKFHNGNFGGFFKVQVSTS